MIKRDVEGKWRRIIEHEGMVEEALISAEDLLEILLKKGTITLRDLE